LLVESSDEAFLDVTGSARVFGRPEEIARKLKDSVFMETGLTVSAGVAPSKFVAKIASDMEKPDAFGIPGEKIWKIRCKNAPAFHGSGRKGGGA
jgi:DNA polymerase IV